MKYVIIGNSAAAVGAVEAIRRNDKAGEIVIISDEAHHTYSRPLISYLLLGKTDEQRMKYRADSFYADNSCTFMSSQKAVAIDPDKKSVTLESGEAVTYDKLLVAAGSSPFVPPMKGLETVRDQFTFSSLDDAKALETKLTPQSRVLIIGAGLIGLKCAEGIRDRVAKITVVDLAPRILSSILDDGASDYVRPVLEKNGLQFYLEDSVKEFSANSAELNGGAKIAFDILVLAVGVRANTALIGKAGGKVGRGITIDEHMATSIPDVYAAGDCTESADASTGDVKIMALLPNAYMQGECAGCNMSGRATVFNEAIPMNAIGFFGTHIVSAGNYTGDAYFDGNDGYKKLFYGDNKLNGFIIIGDKHPENGKPVFDKAGVYTAMIREKTPLDSLDFELICQSPGLIAFSREVREEKLGGEQ